MKIRRLGWAGIEIEHDGASAVIDLVEDLSSMEAFVGPPRGPLPPPRAAGAASLALVTHLHGDHADPAALGRSLAPDGLIGRPRSAEGEPLETAALAWAERGLAGLDRETVEAEPWQTIEAGPFSATAVPAVDGFGDPQVSWVLEAGGRRVLHAGDTLFHGSWWLTRMRCGPIDAAFLPVNGPIVSLPHRQPPSAIEAAMNPEQAVLAASILGAERIVPIHYDTIHQPPAYAQTGDALPRVEAAAAGVEGLAAVPLAVGETLDL